MDYLNHKESIKGKLIAFLEEGNGSFDQLAVDILHFQLEYNALYRKFFELLDCSISLIKRASDIPCLPVSLMKGRKITAFPGNAEKVFFSSGTTDQLRSEHHISDLNWYQYTAVSTFQKFYGSPSEYNFLGILPNYLAQENSSLIYMVKTFMGISKDNVHGLFDKPDTGFFETLLKAEKNGKPTIIFGVTFALLDLAEKLEMSFKEDVTIMETGGMKGRRKELVREELHQILKNAFHVSSIHSEYGMTELQSQAYSQGDGLFAPGPFLEVNIMELSDCRILEKNGNSGLIHMIDLANYESMPFLATNDIGRKYPDGTFEVLGRMDGAELRGCNLMYGSY